MSDPSRSLILVKHARPELDAAKAPREWPLADEGVAQARRLVEPLAPYRPFVLRSSTEPKAARTAEIVAEAMEIEWQAVAGLEEIDRRRLDLVSEAEFRALVRPIFEQPSRAVLGAESGYTAGRRFGLAVQREVEALPTGHDLVVVAHGTVIALFVGRHNDAIDAFALWNDLECGGFIVLDLDDYALREVVARLP